MKKRWLALLLVLTLVMSLTACGGKETTGNQGSTGDKAQTSTDKAETGETTGGDTAEETWTWPLAEKEELSMWIVYDSEFVDDMDDLLSVQETEKNTNVHINWSEIMSAEATEKFGLLMAAGDYPDIIRGAESYYSGGLAKMVDDGVAVDLTDLVPKYMPIYQGLRTSDVELEKSTKTDDGRLVGVYTLASRYGEIKGEKPWDGLVVRKDWVEELGMELPVTIDDWYEVLTAFKTQMNVEAPLMIAADGVDNASTFVSAWGILQEFYTPDGKKVEYGVLQPGYKEFVETMRKWYAEGLIDPNFVSNDAALVTPHDYIGTGRAGAGNSLWGHTAHVLTGWGLNSEEDFYLQAIPAPVLNEGDTPLLGFRMSEKTKESLVITTNCDNVELALRWLDYNYTEESMMLDSLGVEGKTYYQDEAGVYHVTQEMADLVAAGEYPNLSEAVYAHTLRTSDFGLYNWGMFEALYEGDEAFTAYDFWAPGSYEIALPAGITLTDAENAEYTGKYVAIKTLVDEWTVKFIMGTEPMDKYDSFVQSLYDYGIEECIGYQQAAFDRFNAR